MQRTTHSDEAKARLRALVSATPGVEVRPMFGSLGAFVHGRMYASLYGERLGVKVAPEERADLQSLPGVGPFGPVTRPLPGWFALPVEMPDADVAGWFDRAHAYVSSLPPKESDRPRPPHPVRGPRP